MQLMRMLVCVLMIWTGSAAAAVDPFDKARWAIETKDHTTAIGMIENGEIDVNTQTQEGYTLLHFAAGAGNLAMVNALLERGADPLIKSSLGKTPYDSAVGTMVQTRLKKAMAEGSPQAKQQPQVDAGGADFDKVRWLIGARRNADAIAELDKGIDINMQAPGGHTLLHHAANDNNLAMVKELLRRGANPNIRSESGYTPADMAIGTTVLAEVKKAGGKQNMTAPAKAAPAAAKQASTKASQQSAQSTSNSPHAELCSQRHYSSSALCSDSTCKMREYRKWQTCLKTGSYD